MEQVPDALISTKLPAHEWPRLIRKLRWIGMEDEAYRLEQAVRTLPAEQRCSVSVQPFSTD
jgi:hypothetical protein